MDLVVSAVLITSIIIGAYSLSSYYTSLNKTYISTGDTMGQFSTAVTSFMLVNSTRAQLLGLQNSVTTESSFRAYILQTLGKELDFPYYISVDALENYSQSTPNVNIFNYSSSGFSQNVSSMHQFNEPIFVTNYSSLCSSSCNYSLQPQSGFPGQNISLSAPNCTVFNNANVRVGPAAANGWEIFNNTPTGSCTLTIGRYATTGSPNNYLVDAYSLGGISDGEITVFSLALDLVSIKIG